MDNEALEKELLTIKSRLEEILASLEEAAVEDTRTEVDMKTFFSLVRKSLFGGRLSTGQVQGMEAKLQAFREAGWSPSWAAYALATSYHETAKRMLPVREGLSVSDAWRKRNLRYYPYYGRGDVQLTWLVNYQRADRELGLEGKLVKNLDLALDPDISAKIMVLGMKEGWFTKKTLQDYLPATWGTKEQFVQARRIINGTDRANDIAGYAVQFQQALKEAGYGTADNR